MSELVKNILKWFLVFFLVVLLLFLIIKLVRNNKKEGNPITPIVDTVREVKPQTEITNNNETNNEKNTTSTLIVKADDTGTSRGISSIIGIIILGSTSYFIMKNKVEQ